VVDGVTAAMDLFTEESFGPIVAIIRARDSDHAVELANDSQYGLAASVFTRDIVKGLGIARRINSGICHINGPTVHDEPQMPFGGVGASGHGRFGGRQGIDSFTETRWITIETQPGQFPI
jgi:acyl-CoA reductase-like NAD-dependent aldehyde dehydrogenase